MDYKNHYINLITTRYNRKREKNVYYEKHHIIPKCLNGSDKKENIVYLTPREHYIAHWLLHRIRPHSNKLSYSFWIMNWPGTKKVKREYRISSRMYEEARTAMKNSNSRRMDGSGNHRYGKSMSENQKKKISESCKGKRNTPEQRKRQSLAQMKPINQFTKDGVFIARWNSIKEATNELNLHDSAISGVCKGKRKSHGGFKFEYIQH